MKTFKGVVFYEAEDGRIAFAGGLNTRSFWAGGHDEAFRRLLTLQSEDVLDRAFEIQVIEIFPERPEEDSAYFGERRTLSLRSALQKAAVIEDARSMPSVEEINLERANMLAARFGLDLRLEPVAIDTSPSPEF